MHSFDIIGALTALANATTVGDSLIALDNVRLLLGRDIENYHPLLDSLTKRAMEIDHLRRLARYDTLTGIYNRRSFEEAFKREFARFHRAGEPFTLVVLDLDNLKQINDQQGHTMGDRALKIVADECVESVRSTDVVARLGGDEFAIILIGSDAKNARAFIDRLRSVIERHCVGDRPLGISVGIATACDESTSTEELFCEADADLYRDKYERKGGYSDFCVLEHRY